MGCIYVIENKLNAKQYVGKTKHTVDRRWAAHKQDMKRSTSKFYNAIRKYGIENFEVFIWEECSFDLLNEREKYWIEVLGPEYNIQPGGTGGGSGKVGRRWRIKDTSNMCKPKTQTEAVIAGRKQITGANNYQSTCVIYTPQGTFYTWQSAKLVLRMDVSTIQKYCKKNILIPNGKRTRKEWRNKMSRDVGFYVEERNENKSS